MKTYQQIADKIHELLAIRGSHYFTVNGVNDTTIKIRVSDHLANKFNNKGETVALSFISSRKGIGGYNNMVREWEVMTNGMTTTYEEIVDILEWEGVVL